MVGVDRVRPPRAGEAAAVRSVVEPASAEEVAELVRKCEADKISLAPLGGARTLSQIRRGPVSAGVSLSRMNRVVECEPADMTVVAEAGMSVAELNRHMAASGQRLPVDPADPHATALGALIGAAKAGPLRLSEGTVRDLLIGVRFVGHGGRLVRGGGRVVKNVAGYDLMKVMIGSFGTLGIVVEAAFKVRPIPERYALVLAGFAAAGAAFTAADKLARDLPLCHLEVLSAGLGAEFGRPHQTVLLAGLCGSASEVDYLAGRAVDVLGSDAAVLSGNDAASAYERLRDSVPEGASLVAKLAVRPAELAIVLGDCAAEFRAHAGCGVAEIHLDGQADPCEAAERVARWRALARKAGGHLNLLAAAPGLRERLEFFDRPERGALGLMRRLKASFDPAGIFNPGCFVGGL